MIWLNQKARNMYEMDVDIKISDNWTVHRKCLCFLRNIKIKLEDIKLFPLFSTFTGRINRNTVGVPSVRLIICRYNLFSRFKKTFLEHFMGNSLLLRCNVRLTLMSN